MGSFTISQTLLALIGLGLMKVVSEVVYNLFFHPLRKYPGPLLWRATAFPYKLALVKGTMGFHAPELHNKYGETVRIAPNELSYVQPQSYKDILGRPGKKEMLKDVSFAGTKVNGAWTMVTAPYDDHRRMRRLFTHGFSTTALRAQEPLLVKYCDQMVEKISEVSKGPDGKVNILDVLNFTTFDIMAELSFGESLHMLESMEYSPWVSIIFKGLKFVCFRGVLPSIPFFGPLLSAWMAPKIEARSAEHQKFASDLVDKRLAWTDCDKPDFWNFVLRHNEDGKGLTRAEMQTNAAAFMVAGTDTTAGATSGLIWYLCRNRSIYDTLVKEICTTFKHTDEITLGPLMEMEYLNAVIQEGLRLYTPGGAGITRIVPEGGADVLGDYLPEGISVTISSYAAYQHPSNFSEPTRFAPERWIKKDSPRWAKDRREVYEPFGWGPRNCIGKNLAMLELRLLLTKILYHYDIELLPECQDWIRQKTFITWQKPPLMIKATRRQ
ncbi:cytochrome P450 [Xylariaceae sp. FL1651]|nr:cytochrome P450 [Xylariaceae sp. FL1651]